MAAHVAHLRLIVFGKAGQGEIVLTVQECFGETALPYINGSDFFLHIWPNVPHVTRSVLHFSFCPAVTRIYLLQSVKGLKPDSSGAISVNFIISSS